MKATSVRYHGRKTRKGVVPVREHLRGVKSKVITTVGYSDSHYPDSVEMQRAVNTYLDNLAEKHNLSPEERKDFIVYTRIRFMPDVKAEAKYAVTTGYIDEWAGRFQRGVEYDRSDLSGMRLLRKINPAKYADTKRYPRLN